VTGRTPLRGLLDVTAPFPAEPVRLDDVDRRLLTLLAGDARASQRKLARDLHMSPPAVGERIARLERLGVIRRYTVDVDWTALGYFSVFVTVTAVQGADQAVILQALRRLPEVEAIVVITGSIDMLARLRVRSHAHLRQVLLSEVWRIDGVQRTETFIALAEMATKEDYVGELLALPHPDEREGDGASAPATGRRRADHAIRSVESVESVGEAQ
jgi:Lrp/AsnC family transcriptional regulator, leucine-responsive regulatory protein